MGASDSDSGDGFSLLEVLVAFIVLALVISTMAVSISYSSRLYRQADDIRKAQFLAQKLISEMMNLPGEQIDHEEGRDENGLKWSVERKKAPASFASGRPLYNFSVTIYDPKGRQLQTYQTFYRLEE